MKILIKLLTTQALFSGAMPSQGSYLFALGYCDISQSLFTPSMELTILS